MLHSSIGVLLIFMSLYAAQADLMKKVGCSTYQRYERFKLFTQYLHRAQRPQSNLLHTLSACRVRTKFKVGHKSIRYYDKRTKQEYILKRPTWWR